MTVDLRKYYDAVTYEPVDTFLHMLPGHIELHDLNLNPDYQRGHVWTEQQAGLFVGHILEGGTTTRLLMNCDRRFALPSEIVDGKQRVAALLRWLNDDLAAIFFDGTLCKISDVSEDSQVEYKRITIPFGRIYLSRPEVLRLYIRLNRGGSVHTDAEIEKVRALLAAERPTGN